MYFTSRHHLVIITLRVHTMYPRAPQISRIARTRAWQYLYKYNSTSQWTFILTETEKEIQLNPVINNSMRKQPGILPPSCSTTQDSSEFEFSIQTELSKCINKERKKERNWKDG